MKRPWDPRTVQIHPISLTNMNWFQGAVTRKGHVNEPPQVLQTQRVLFCRGLAGRDVGTWLSEKACLERGSGCE